jgi:hypothetical protein
MLPGILITIEAFFRSLLRPEGQSRFACAATYGNEIQRLPFRFAAMTARRFHQR